MNTRWILVILLTVMMIAIIWRNEMSDMGQSCLDKMQGIASRSNPDPQMQFAL